MKIAELCSISFPPTSPFAQRGWRRRGGRKGEKDTLFSVTLPPPKTSDSCCEILGEKRRERGKEGGGDTTISFPTAVVKKTFVLSSPPFSLFEFNWDILPLRTYTTHFMTSVPTAKRSQPAKREEDEEDDFTISPRIGGIKSSRKSFSPFITTVWTRKVFKCFKSFEEVSKSQLNYLILLKCWSMHHSSLKMAFFPVRQEHKVQSSKVGSIFWIYFGF